MQTYLRQIWAESEKEACPIAKSTGRAGEINLSDIFSKLVQAAGRFCEHYASDILIDCESIKRAVNEKVRDEIQLVGVRESGTDHAEFIRSRASEWYSSPEMFFNYYRRVYAIRITTDEDGWSRVELRDVKKHLNPSKITDMDQGEVLPVVEEDLPIPNFEETAESQDEPLPVAENSQDIPASAAPEPDNIPGFLSGMDLTDEEFEELNMMMEER